MALFSLTFRMLLALLVVVSPMVCCCTSNAAAQDNAVVLLDSDAGRGVLTPPVEGNCHRQADAGASDAVPARSHPPGDCLDCLDMDLTADNGQTQLNAVSISAAPDTAGLYSLPRILVTLAPVTSYGRSVTGARDGYSRDSLRSLSRLLLI